MKGSLRSLSSSSISFYARRRLATAGIDPARFPDWTRWIEHLIGKRNRARRMGDRVEADLMSRQIREDLKGFRKELGL